MSGRLKWIAKKIRGAKILDIGFVGEEGTEPTVHKIIRENNPGSYIVGLDNNEERVKKLNFPNSVVASAQNIPFPDNHFSTAVLAEVIEHIIEPYGILKEIHRVLDTKGRIYLTTPNPYSLFAWIKHWLIAVKPCNSKNYKSFLGCRDHKMFWEPLSLCNILSTIGFDIIEITTVNIDIPYMPKKIKNLYLPFWPFNRIGSYCCLIAEKK